MKNNTNNKYDLYIEKNESHKIMITIMQIIIIMKRK